MKKSIYTPGPWRVNGKYVVAGRNSIAEISNYLDYTKIPHLPYPCALANAALIAGAPGMFEVLKEIEEDILRLPLPKSNTPSADKILISRILTAIRKAEEV